SCFFVLVEICECVYINIQNLVDLTLLFLHSLVDLGIYISILIVQNFRYYIILFFIMLLSIFTIYYYWKNWRYFIYF
ncbi:hypothetical protein ACJX0J_014927, partial [Zea mays]